MTQNSSAPQNNVAQGGGGGGGLYVANKELIMNCVPTFVLTKSIDILFCLSFELCL